MLIRHLFYPCINIINLIRLFKKAAGLPDMPAARSSSELSYRISFRDVVPSGTKGRDHWFSSWAIGVVMSFKLISIRHYSQYRTF